MAKLLLIWKPEKCLCPICPVQADSACTKEKLMKMHEVMQNELPEPDIVLGLYCANNKAMCTIWTSKNVLKCVFLRFL